MTDDDLTAFGRALEAVGYVCTGRRIAEDMIAVYFNLLKDVAVLPLVRALERFANHVDTGRKMPTPREIRAWVSGDAGASGLRPDQETRIRIAVGVALDDWELADGHGSARPVFQRAFRMALAEEGITGPTNMVLREDIWQRWLRRGATAEDSTSPIPVATRAAILRDIAARDARGEFSLHGESGRVAWMAKLADDLESGRALLSSNPFVKILGHTAAGKPLPDAWFRRRTSEREPGEEG